MPASFNSPACQHSSAGKHRHPVVRKFSHFVLFVIALTFITSASSGIAEDAANVFTPEMNQNSIRGRMEQVSSSDAFEDDEREAILSTYKEALAELKEANKYDEALKNYENEIDNAPGKMAELQKELDSPPGQVEVDPPSEAPLTELESNLRQAESTLSDARSEVNELQAESTRRAERRTEIPDILAELQNKLKETSEKLSAYPEAEVASEQTAARRTLLLARRKALESRIKMLKEERLSYDAREELLPLRIDLAARKARQAQLKVEAWETIVSQRRQRAAEEAVREAERARRQAAKEHAMIQQLASENQQLASRLIGPEGLQSKIKSTKKGLEKAVSLNQELQNEFQNIQEKIAAVGLNQAVGMLLLKKRATLPQIQRYERRIKLRTNEIANTQFELIELEERRADLSVIDPKVEEIIKRIPSSVKKETRDNIATEAAKLLKSRRDILDSLLRNYNTYFSNLVELDTTERRLTETVQAFSSYIKRHVLWIRSAPVLSPSSLSAAWSGVQWLGSPSNWNPLLQRLWNNLKSNIIIYGAFSLLLALLLFARPHLHGKVDELSEVLHKTKTDSIFYTPYAMLLTALLAIPGPLLLLFAAWRLKGPSVGTDFSSAISGGLRASGYYWLVLSFLSYASHSSGLVHAHFRIPKGAALSLKRHIKWFTLIVLPAVFLTRTFQAQTNEMWTESIGRVAYIVSMGALSIFLASLLKPEGAVVKSIFRRNREGYMYRGRYFWYGLLILSPIVLIILSILGYQYSAFRLATRFHLSLVLITVIAFIHYLAQRWIILVRRRLAAELVQKQLAAKQEEADTEGTLPEDEARVEESPEDLYSLSQQTRRFLRMALTGFLILGLWTIWSEVLPALGILQKITLWTVSAGSGGEVVPITLANVLLGIIVLGLTIFAARNIPGLLEIVLLQHLPLDRGVKFAINTLCRYVLVIIGVVMTAAHFGIGWGRVQWLVAAMGVGLGFGLQEIFGNFISGLIILFERPMRVGDTVTVGDVFGTVTKIRIRATTIQQWDRKELIVPNKEFITGRLTNWTLSDNILRMEFPVGIAYGSDIDLAEKCLNKIARDTENVLDDPPPRVLFKSFGDSALQFELRIFISNMDHYVDIRHQINQRIDRVFRESGITIAFPQQDVHLDMGQKGLPDSLQAENGEENEA